MVAPQVRRFEAYAYIMIAGAEVHILLRAYFCILVWKAWVLQGLLFCILNNNNTYNNMIIPWHGSCRICRSASSIWRCSC